MVGRLKTSLGSGSAGFSLKRENRNIMKSLNLYPIDGSDLYGASGGSIAYVYLVRIVEALIYALMKYLILCLPKLRMLGLQVRSPEMLGMYFLSGVGFFGLLLLIESYLYSKVLKMEKKTAAYIILHSLSHIFPIKIAICLLTAVLPLQITSFLDLVAFIASIVIVGYIQATCVKNLEIGSRTEREEMIKHIVMMIGQLLVVLTTMHLLYVDISVLLNSGKTP